MLPPSLRCSCVAIQLKYRIGMRMRIVVAFGLGIMTGVTGLLVLQHPRSIEVLRAASGVTSSAPRIKDGEQYPDPKWCAANPQVECK